MRVRSAQIDELRLELAEPFETSFGVQRHRRLLIVNLETSDGLIGRGECVATEEPRYSSETVETARWAILSFLLPKVFRMRSVDPAAFRVAVAPFRGNAMAKAAVEGALWDLSAQQHGRSLSHELGGRRTRIEVGVSVGIQPTVASLVRRVGRYLDEGYRRVKLKVRPGWDARPVGAVRREFPDLRLWVDANQAYPPRSLDAIRGWAERYEVEQVEQPFPEHAFSAHARLARGAPFKVCLDESVVDPWSLEDALDRGSLTSLNVKAGRVGGLGIGLEMGKRAARARLPAWVGGMLETGIGRAGNVALASCSPFSFPGDLSASARYFTNDIAEPAFVLGPESTLAVPRVPGLGVTIVGPTYRRHLRRRVLRRA
jgi:o-succinylbenzoate synthase